MKYKIIMIKLLLNIMKNQKPKIKKIVKKIKK